MGISERRQLTRYPMRTPIRFKAMGLAADKSEHFTEALNVSQGGFYFATSAPLLVGWFANSIGWRWALGPLALLAAVAVWLAPMLIAANHDPALAQYRDEILFKQTVNRYADPWHHREPFWYFFVEVIPPLWLPLTALLPWLVPRWRQSWRARDLRFVLPLASPVHAENE